ncbi:flagella basal body P-ring formation protein FlgA [Thiohalospira halophila DSM 15071]|uniref:Flagella basal body P-ring formation protein FlgA n=1 Tax=Thiohalospira halophila DSM 15071 TaxID=1123397 RepID=A0A1I1WH04_9GAMM|nr:flagellar basal body P-ring formation chaperone FlgA [Thiohalospira halophila]SFD92370.1 flagella basal body P-ring formation protein FlgA [Thiohalospira halophila DSM 15071]
MQTLAPLSLLRILLVALLFASAAQAQEDEAIQSPASIERAIEAFVVHQVPDRDGRLEIEVGYIDPRLRLTQCGHEPEVFLPPNTQLSGRATVGVQCQTPERWRVYIPVEVRHMIPVVVARNPIYRGETVERGDLGQESRDTSGLRGGHFTDPGEVAGQQAERRLRPGRVISGRDVAPPILVERGARVTITAGSGGFAVSVKGEALADGRKGETIPVRNLSSEREVDAEVVGPGRVQVR